MKAIELTSENFDSTINESTLPVLVDFHAQWCGPCKMLSPVIEQIAEEQEGSAIVAKVDIDQAKDIAQRFGVSSIPTLMVFKDGEAVANVLGMQTKAALEGMLEKAK